MRLIKCLFLALLIVGCSTGYDGPISDHWDGSEFYNKEPGHTFFEMIKWFWEMETLDWPEWIEDPEQPDPPEKCMDGELRVTYINHATLLIQTDGLNVLTDPIWSDRAGPFSWAGPKRVRSAGVALENMPRVDVILISHDHFDHLDLPTLSRIAEKNEPTILVGLGLKTLLESEGLSNVHELDWWQTYKLKNSVFTFVPARHNSGRSVLSGNKTLWGGYVIEGDSGRIYFAGDTAYGDFLQKIITRYPDFRAAIFPIGSYEKRWFMKSQHMNPEDALKAHILLNSQQSIGMHFGTFEEHVEQTIDAHEKDLKMALTKNKIPESEFLVLKFGEGRYIK
ncbi:MAG: MBL fold metallo-hydrolase [Thermodesulfovibrionales bacterium]|nr:MBL fold metallo-hydrolase [Thermodesulfovibrionales bacterium]